MIQPDRIVTTTCPYCGVGCKLQLHIQDDFIYKVTSPHDALVNQGNLCVKGRFGYDFLYHPDRVTVPLVRKTTQRPGARTQAFDRSEWQEISWDAALDLVTDRLVDIYRRDGADALAVYCCAKATNEDNYLLQKLFRALFRTNNVDHCTRLCHAGSVVALQMAVGSSAMSNTAAEVIHSDVFMITGSNTAETHPIIALQMKAAVEKHGAKLIVVDPRRVEMVNFATLWLPERPGTDVPVFSAMAHVILEEKLYNARVHPRTDGRIRRIRPLHGAIHARIRRGHLRGGPQPHRRGGAALRRGAERRDLLGAGHPRTHPRHGQRAGAHPPGAADRPHRPAGHRAEPPARAEQRPGRVGRRRHALALPRLPAGGGRGRGAQSSRRPGA